MSLESALNFIIKQLLLGLSRLEMLTRNLNSRHFVFSHEDDPLIKFIVNNWKFSKKSCRVSAGFEPQTFCLSGHYLCLKTIKEAYSFHADLRILMKFPIFYNELGKWIILMVKNKMATVQLRCQHL